MPKKTNAQLEQELLQLQGEIGDKNSNIDTLNQSITDLNEESTSLNQTITELNESISQKDTDISTLEALKSTNEISISEKDSEIKELTKKVKRKAARKFSESFKDEKDEHKQKMDFWTLITIVTFGILLFTTYYVIEKSLYLKPENIISILIIESIAFTLLVFSSKQYSYFRNHYSTSLRRETLAQGYQNILEGGEDNQIEPEYKHKIIDVLCENKIDNDKKNNIPQEKVFDKAVELLDSVSKLRGTQ